MLAPAAKDGTEHGKPPAHGALAETKPSPAGVGSVITRLVASDGPLLVTVMV